MTYRLLNIKGFFSIWQLLPFLVLIAIIFLRLTSTIIAHIGQSNHGGKLAGTTIASSAFGPAAPSQSPVDQPNPFQDKDVAQLVTNLTNNCTLPKPDDK